MKKSLSRRTFLNNAAKTSALTAMCSYSKPGGAFGFNSISEESTAAVGSRIVDIHTHYDATNPKYIDDFLRVSDQLNLTGCMLTPFAHRQVVADAAKKYPKQIIPFGSVDLDAPDVAKQVEELHGLGYRGLGEMEFVRKPYGDPGYFPVYELANSYKWVMLFHTGIVLRAKFTEPEEVASYRMSS